jgi:hypothetical protein
VVQARFGGPRLFCLPSELALAWSSQRKLWEKARRPDIWVAENVDDLGVPSGIPGFIAMKPVPPNAILHRANGK